MIYYCFKIYNNNITSACADEDVVGTTIINNYIIGWNALCNDFNVLVLITD